MSQQLDLVSVFLAAQRQNAMRQQAELEQERLQLARQQALIPEARQAYFERGDPSMLNMLDPQGLANLKASKQGLLNAQQQQINLEQQGRKYAAEADQSAVEQARSSSIGNSKFLKTAVGLLSQNPNSLPMVMGMAQKQAQQGILAPETLQMLGQIDPTNQEAFPQVLQQLGQAADMGLALAGDQVNYHKWSKDAAAELGYVENGGDAERAMREKPEEMKKAIAQFALASKKRGQYNIINQMPGKKELSPGAETEIQKKQQFYKTALGQVTALERAPSDLFGGWANIKEKGIGILDFWKLAPEKQQEWLGRKQWLTSENGLFILNLVRAQSGAQVSDKEREAVEMVAGNAKNMSEAQFKMAMRTIKRVILREMAANMETMREGFDVSAAGQAATGYDIVDSSPERRKAINDLGIKMEKAGASREEFYKALLKKRWIIPKPSPIDEAQ